MSYGRFSSKKGMKKAIAAGLKEFDFYIEGNGKINMDMINKKLKPKKIKKTKKTKKVSIQITILHRRK